jgi:O-glycosyl hydrolase
MKGYIMTNKKNSSGFSEAAKRSRPKGPQNQVYVVQNPDGSTVIRKVRVEVKNATKKGKVEKSDK